MSEALFWLALTALLTGVLWVPYTLERILRRGPLAALGYAPAGAGFDQPDETPPGWAVRAHGAHRNALENLPVFAALVLTAQVAGVAGGLVAVAAQVFFFARLVHVVVYMARVPVLRTLAFLAGFGAELAIAAVLLGAA